MLVTLYAHRRARLERARARLQESLDAPARPSRSCTSSARSRWTKAATTSASRTASPSRRSTGSGAEPRPGDGLPNAAGGWRALAPGEFVLGYHDEDGGLPLAPMPPFDRNSTYVVYRKMQMHPGAHAQRTCSGSPTAATRTSLAAKLVGRWQDGTPLISSPARPDPAIANDPARVNDFRYARATREGLACPIGAHVRRANPRDDDGFFGGKLSDRHRIIRRGRAYGPALADGVLEDDGEDRGLIFKCYQADIERQFEMIQSLWIDDGDSFGVGDDKDPIIGLHSEGGGRMIVQGRPPVVMSKLPTFVTVRGGEYLVRPGCARCAGSPGREDRHRGRGANANREVQRRAGEGRRRRARRARGARGAGRARVWSPTTSRSATSCRPPTGRTPAGARRWPAACARDRARASRSTTSAWRA